MTTGGNAAADAAPPGSAEWGGGEGALALRQARLSAAPGETDRGSAPAGAFPSRPGGAASEATRRRERGVERRRPLYAALDLGTNNCRLLVARPEGDSFRVIDSFSRIVRLGEGLAQTGALSEAAMERAVGALMVCEQKLARREITGSRLIATEACRRAVNGTEFLARVRAETGLHLEVIDRRTEAGLAASGCSALMDPEADGAILFDIGGGSTEIVWLDRRRAGGRRGLVRDWTSLPLGVVTLAETFGGGAHVDRGVYEAMVAHVRRAIQTFGARHRMAAAVRDHRYHLLGTSGTVTTLAGVHLRLPRYDRRQVDGLWLDADVLDGLVAELLSMDFEARRQNVCVGRDRADLVLPGCAILEAIRREWPCERLRVADRGLREGILIRLMRADGHHRPRGRDDRRR